MDLEFYHFMFAYMGGGYALVLGMLYYMIQGSDGTGRHQRFDNIGIYVFLFGTYLLACTWGIWLPIMLGIQAWKALKVKWLKRRNSTDAKTE